MLIEKEEISEKGMPLIVTSMKVDDKVIIIKGKVVKTARIKEEWFDDIGNPEPIIRKLKAAKDKPDIFTFWQRLPETKPKYNYYMERESVSALPIPCYDDWWQKQISSAIRNKVRKAQKKGVVVKVVGCNDELIRGIMEIFNETPVRRGKPFWHYGKDFEVIKRELSTDLDRSDFIGAYYNDQLIGFVKLRYAGILADFIQNLSLLKHRDKFTNNALIAKAVELCAEKKIPYLTYGGWRKGDHAAFLLQHGFEKIDLPRYYVPLTLTGNLVIKLRLHRGIIGILPESLLLRLIDLRSRWYTKRYFQKSFG